ncbi:MAG: hypothetical protein ACRDPF_06375 [Streptosporangiaceae bacterium]
MPACSRYKKITCTGHGASAEQLLASVPQERGALADRLVTRSLVRAKRFPPPGDPPKPQRRARLSGRRPDPLSPASDHEGAEKIVLDLGRR